jgi:DNA polymerase III subunit gamma/tau
MNYQVLARKWRPKSFSQIIGQDHVTRALKNALDNNRLHHAYLFTGTRGIGKTTFARIFAKCLNCTSKITSNPCGKCIACQEIDAGHFIDLIEIDAASRTKVEDTRELLDNVQYAPTYGRYKIYLIDEVHMLSTHSFNALLKTLEEPPAHVKFLLATTDPQKLPITILSRCLQFNLKTVPSEKIAEHLADILQQEQITFELPALQQLARCSEGSVRDALSLLDQAIAYGNNNVALADVNAMLGATEDTYLLDIVTALTKHDATAAFTTINLLGEQAADFFNVLENLLSLLHNIALMQKVPAFVDDNYHSETLKQLASLLTPEDVQLFYQIGLIGRRDLSFSPNPKSGFEMLILRMLAFYPEFIDRATTKANPTRVSNHDLTATIPNLEAKNWTDILARLNLSPPTKAFAANCSIGSINDDHVELLLHTKHAPILNQKHEDRLTAAFNALFQRPIKISIRLTDTTTGDTPQDLAKQDFDRKQKIAEEVIQNNNNIQAMLKNFGATIVPLSIKQKNE